MKNGQRIVTMVSTMGSEELSIGIKQIEIVKITNIYVGQNTRMVQ